MADWGPPTTAPADSGWNSNEGAGSEWNDTTTSNGGVSFGGIEPEQVSKHDQPGADATCRRCQQPGHFTRDCPKGGDEAGGLTGECYNCGQVGHNKSDCTNERVEREFSGTCNHCGETGHRKSACPNAPPETCKRCSEEGHTAKDCTNAYKVYGNDVEDLDPDEAWQKCMAADTDDDLDNFKKYFSAYCKAAPTMDFPTLQTAFREANMKTWLVAKQQEVSITHTIVDLQGKADCTYVVSFQYGLAPRRAKSADAWPKTEEENLERLKDAGFPKDRHVPKCSNCNELGHISKACTEERAEIEKPEITCTNCKESGHYLRDCPMPRVDKNTCRNCNQPGHRASDCTEPRSAENVECRKCSQMGHFSKDCPNAPKFECRNCGQEGHRASDCTEERKITCRNCNGEGHVSRDCPEPKNMANVQCRNCNQMGHGSRDCPEPKDWSKVECRNCGEKGHGAGRCKNPPKEETDGGFENSGFDTAAPAASGGWEAASADTGAPSGGDAWGSPPAATSAW